MYIYHHKIVKLFCENYGNINAFITLFTNTANCYLTYLRVFNVFIILGINTVYIVCCSSGNYLYFPVVIVVFCIKNEIL